MKDFIDSLTDGNLWMAYILYITPLIILWLKENYKKNPRQKYLPFWHSAVLLVIVLLNLFKIISPQITWVLIVLELIVFIYLYLLNTTLKVSYESLMLKKIKKDLECTEIDDYKIYYHDKKRSFVSQLGRYNYGMMCIQYFISYEDYSSSFKVLDDIEKLNLTNEEQRSFLMMQFGIYCETKAVKLWADKYCSIKALLNEDDKLHVDSILSIFKLELDAALKSLDKLLASTKNASYIQIAENNIAVISERKAQAIEWNDYIHKSYRSSKMINSNLNITTPNLVHYYLHNKKPEKAEEEFYKYIKSIPDNLLINRIRIANEKLLYYSQIGDSDNLKNVIESLFEEYQNASEVRKYPLLVSLFRLSFNHQLLFEEVLTEVESILDVILELEISILILFIRDIRGVWKSSNLGENRSRIKELLSKCNEKLKTIDIDNEISKLRKEEVAKKRDYIIFKADISDTHLHIESTEDFISELYNKFDILDELIMFDEKQDVASFLLHSLFLKLDEVTNAICNLRCFDESLAYTPAPSTVFLELQKEGYYLISRILPIIEKANKAKMMAEYHLQLAHHYCCLDNCMDGYKHFQMFKSSNVNALHFADWLKEWYYRLESYFIKKEM